MQQDGLQMERELQNGIMDIAYEQVGKRTGTARGTKHGYTKYQNCLYITYYYYTHLFSCT